MDYTSHSDNLLIELSDHLIQFLFLEGFIKERSVPAINMYKRDFSQFNHREFKDEIIYKVNWEGICNFRDNDPSRSFKSFYDTFNHYLDEYAPYKKVTRKNINL